MTRLRALALLLVGQLALCLWARSAGFPAISDDDYARVTLAQAFAQAPALDPTGSSWLPLPFWLYGCALALTGATLEVARATAVTLALGGAALLYGAGRLLGLGRAASLAGSLALAALPTVRPLAVATVPEFWCAALATYGLASLSSNERPRLFGALALGLGCACRYEIWPLALGFAGLSLVDAVREPRARQRLAIAAAGALAFPLIWLVYGQIHHGSALFFIARVQNYKAALGTDNRLGLELWTSYGKALLTREPELTAVCLSALLASFIARPVSTMNTKRWRVVAPGLLALVILTLGDVRGGAPTHHAERALLTLWMTGGLVALATLLPLGPRRAGLVVLLSALLALPFRVHLEPSSYGPRPEEEEIGRVVRERLSADERVVVATTDYGYFAVEAAAGSPKRFSIANRHDPRDPKNERPLAQRARDAGRETKACFVVAPLCIELEGVTVVAESSAFQLSRFDDPRCAR